LVRANDHDMFLRIAWRCGAVHVREPLGLFLARPDSMSGSAHRAETLREALLVMRRYRTAIPLDDLFPALRRDDSAAAFAAAWFELGNLCALGPYTDAELALACYRRAVDRAPDDAAVRAAFANNAACILAAAESPDAGLALACYRRAVDRAPDDAAVRAAFANNAACILAAAESPDAGLRALRAAPSGAEAARNARTFAACRDAGTKPRLTDLAFVE